MYFNYTKKKNIIQVERGKKNDNWYLWKIRKW